MKIQPSTRELHLPSQETPVFDLGEIRALTSNSMKWSSPIHLRALYEGNIKSASARRADTHIHQGDQKQGKTSE